MKSRYITTPLTRMAAIMILAVGLMTSSAMAQNKHGAGFAPVGFYTGVEAAAGTLEPTTGNHYGNTLVMNSYGEWETYCLTVSIDYSITQFVPNSYIVTGGSWSLVVFRDGVYAGTLYGTVPSGNVLVSTNSSSDSIKLTQINLLTTGGLGAFNNKEFRDINGVMNATTDIRSSEAAGNVALSF